MVRKRKSFINMMVLVISEVILMGKDICGRSPFVGIAGALGGILFVIILFLLIFRPDQWAIVAINVAWAFVVIGFFLSLFAFLAEAKGKKK